MANERGKAIDNTHLSIDQAEARGFIHRDYIAHCLRWTHVAKYLQSKYKEARVLDIGCGVDLPLARLLYSSRLIVNDYVGVEYNHSKKFKLEPFHSGKFPISAYGSMDFGKTASAYLTNETNEAITDQQSMIYVGDDGWGQHRLPNVVTSFEMLEHVESGHCRAVLQKVFNIMNTTKVVLKENPIAFISTPCYDANVGAAANHVNEMTYQALGALLEDLGFEIQNVYGTFASQRDYKPQLMKDGHLAAYEALSTYYDSNYLATIFAPLYPQFSRNALWELRVAGSIAGYTRKFPPLAEVPGPWSSSANWQDLNADGTYDHG